MMVFLLYNRENLMVIDFFFQILLAIAFFFGMAGIGFLLLRIFRFRGGNVFLDSGIAYFISLCLYTLGAVSVLFTFPKKILALQLFTFLYIGISFLLLSRFVSKRRVDVFFRVHEHMSLLVIGLLAVFFFFLQIYHTSILDEWLHRPVVKSFTENGVFPLVNPLSPDLDFIHSYHYGTQIVSSALQVLTRVGVSESMDVLKLSYFIAAFVLFYGMLLRWGVRKRMAALGAFFVLFAGSSFFLLDAFSVSHIWRLKWIESEWPLNTPPSFSMAGITWVNIVLSVAFIFFLEQVLKNTKKEAVGQIALLGVLFCGFFLISEIFAILILGFFSLLFLWQIFTESRRKMKALMLACVFFLAIFSGIYATGGIVGHIANDATLFFRNLVFSNAADTGRVEIPRAVSGDNPLVTSEIFSLRGPKHWGYPAEKRILTVLEYPFLYMRNFLLEIFFFAMLAYAVWNKRVRLSVHPILSGVVATGFLLPFFFSTSYGTLNLTKLTAFSLMVLHLIGFVILFRAGSSIRKIVLIPMTVLLVFAVIPGTFLGMNMQWRWISGKGQEQACSQNPLCYKGELTDLLRRFEREHPGLKRVAVDPKNAKKVADLTNSYIYRYDDMRAEYIIDTPEWSKVRSADDEIVLASLVVLGESGKYRILKVK